MVTEQIIQKINDGENFVLKGGAGSGKTYTLIEVLKQLIEQNKKIAVITYTNVAKDEIIERLSQKDKEINFCGTIHEFIWNIVSKFQEELNVVVKEKFKTEVNENDNYEIIYDFGYHGVDKESLKIKLSHDEVIEIFGEIINEYEELYGILSNIYDCILVDEYQDTKQVVVDVLLNGKLTISCGFFGDSIQGIYTDQELNMDSISVIPKSDNWRSSSKLVEFFNDIRNNINNDDIKQNALNNEIRDYESRLLYYEVDTLTNSIKKQIESDSNFQINHSLFLTHNLGLANQMEINSSYNNKFKDNQRKYSSNKDEIYPHLNFFFDLYEMKNNIMFETNYVSKYFNVNMRSRDIVEEWNLKIQELKNCNTVNDIKSLDFYDILDEKIREEIENITDEMNIEYFDKMYDYSLEDNEDRTMFSMKGLEADNILIYLDNGRWYQYNFSNLNERTKKILYVAITRAKKNLIIVAKAGINTDLKKIILNFFEKKEIKFNQTPQI
ncbi:MAG: UvrD-helicase domain-containing protein [Mycoplasmatales bacterium]